ncbi:molybdenum cofactor guanylyltransferase [Flavivirga spongiicola]|uniref:Probable molybdenum cofactor guanylyltransferase n=1 Tax=Flavivirga spongiicola TaxID=421621 RepID=A0ABU7XZ34_9FLAO|nr:molybdenum cofactor guanylyltransferase [Flavivirga sp. MEBiC05379]MDO5981055.1 molybdenum cofactor guanylyltransferase [Flavivirga sp. MEBiC05379]
MIDKKDITGIILAGGKSSRMGTDKGFLVLNEKSFIQRSIDAIKPLVSNIIIVSDNPDYDILSYERVTDTIKDAGPIAGICSGLDASQTNYNLVLSCDIPLIKTEILEKLIMNIDTNSDIIQIESNGKAMPLIALYKKQCSIIFNNLLKTDEKRLRMAVSQCRVKNIPLDNNDYNTTMNVNTKEELKQLEDAYND